MPQANKRSDTQRPRTAPASHQTASSLDLGPLHQALPRSPLLSQQNSNSSTPRQQRANGQEATRSVSFLQRTTGKRPSTAESTRRAPSSSPKGKGPSTPEGSRIISAPTRWEGPSLAESNKLFSDKEPPRRPGDSQAVAGRGRKGTGDVATNRLTEQDGIPSVSRLPIDLLCQCFVRVESLYYLVNCASVCKAWREALLSDMIWKTMYLKWWQSSEATESLDLQIRGEVPLFPGGTRTPPEGFDSWRSAFMARFQAGKKQLIVKEKAFAVREGYLAIRAEADTYGKRAFDCVQGDGMQKLSEHLCLNFNVCLNRGRRIKIQGKGKIEIFQNSCIVRYPVAQIGNLNLLGLKSVEVTATSDRVLQVCPIVDFTQLPLTTWEMVSMTSQSTGPLRLLQHCVAPGVTVIVGTLVETIIDTNEIDGKEQLLDLGEGPTSHAARRLRQDELDPQYGLHNWHVSIQFHTFGRNTWTGTFKQVFWNERESIPGEKAVFVLVSHNEVFPGVLKLPWKGEAFSGTLRGVYLVDITLWDGGGEIAWQHTSVARVNPAPVIIVEYGIDFDGEQVYAHIVDNEQGVSVEMKMCIPMNIICQQPGEQRPMTAITNLQVGLTSKFLENWCGVVNI